VALAGQLALLAGLAATVGLGGAGWAAGVAVALLGWAALTRGLTAYGVRVFGPANCVTLTRAVLVGGVAALVADGLVADALAPDGLIADAHVTDALVAGAVARAAAAHTLVGLTVVALSLDAVDGQVARRSATASAFGARFDMEVDAFLILVLSVYASRSFGVWVLAIGAMRYAYVAAGWVLTWLPGPLPPRYWRKVVAAIQGITLAAAATTVLPPALMTMALVGALALLIESFGRDVVWRWRHRRQAALVS
jgi:phosphatidylglycerophosphate synthase